MGPRFIMERAIGAYLNEKNTRTLLRYNKEMFDGTAYLLALQRKERSKLEKEESFDEGRRAVVHMYSVEIERVEWVLKEYLLVRLEKIKNNFYLDDEELLSPGERAFYKKYVDLNKRYGVYQEGEKGLPEIEYGGLYVLEDLGRMVIDGELLDLRKGGFYIANIRGVDSFVAEGKILVL
jgi:hypothetical protein